MKLIRRTNYKVVAFVVVFLLTLNFPLERRTFRNLASSGCSMMFRNTAASTSKH